MSNLLERTIELQGMKKKLKKYKLEQKKKMESVNSRESSNEKGNVVVEVQSCHFALLHRMLCHTHSWVCLSVRIIVHIRLPRLPSADLTIWSTSQPAIQSVSQSARQPTSQPANASLACLVSLALRPPIKRKCCVTNVFFYCYFSHSTLIFDFLFRRAGKEKSKSF